MPLSKKDLNLKEAAENDKTFFLKINNGSLRLKQSHNYYYQCQGGLNILGLDWIDFVVYTSQDIHVEKIMKDELLWKTKMLPSLADFFVKYIFEKI